MRDASGLVSEAASAVIDLDTFAPTSSVGILSPSYSSSPVDVPYTASDEVSGVADVTLWWRFSEDGGATWTAWVAGPISQSSPISFDFAAGSGDYEFYTIATDIAGNVEDAPVSADAGAAYALEPAWSGSVMLNDGPAGSQDSDPSAAITSDGVAVVAWGDRRADADIYVATRELASGGGWSANVRVTDDATTRVQDDVDLAATPDGEVLAAWVDRREGSDSKIQQHIYAARRDGQGTWSANVRVDADPKGASKRDTAIAVGPGGEAVAVWRDLRGNKQKNI